MSSPDASQLLRLAIAIRTELECETNRGLYPRTLHALQALETAIRDEFDLLPRPSKRGRSEEEADSRKRLQNALSYQKRRREDADARLRNFQGKKIGGVSGVGVWLWTGRLLYRIHMLRDPAMHYVKLSNI